MHITIKQLLLAPAILSGMIAMGQDHNAYDQSINNWHKERVESLKKENGWLNLVGLHWLKPGRNTFGSAAGNDIVFPKGTIPASAGYFELSADNTVTLVSNPGVNIKVNNQPVINRVIFHKDSLRAPVVAYENLRWTIIKRDDKIGIRLRDLQSPGITSFKGIDRFTIDPDFKVEATLENKTFPDRISITNVLGQTSLQKSAGKLSFAIHGKTYSLDALDEGGPDLFIIFGDSTNRTESYPSGRFLSVSRPDANGKTVIDFNKAYNPPCAFTDFATCPLPPPQNRLPVAITAGEKKYGEY